MKLFKGLCIFAAGALAGAAVAARVVREKYQQEAEEEIAEMRDYYRELRKNAKTPDEDKMLEEDENNKEEKEENTKDEYNKIVKDYTNYTQYNDTETKENKKEEKEERTNYEPFIIDAEEFGEDPSYDTTTLTYYKDKVLTNDLDDVIDYSVAGEENLKIFDEYPDCKAIYVRDDIYMVDYEIIRDPYQYDEYDDFPDKKPHQL
jgi:hypothetical protein